MGNVTNRAIVLLYCGTEMPQDVIFDAIRKEFGAYMADGSNPSVVVLDAQSIAETLASANFSKIQKDDKTPLEQAITVIGGLFQQELREFSNDQTGLVLKIVGKAGTAKHSQEPQDIAFMKALRIINNVSLPVHNSVAKHWNYTRGVHTAIQNICHTLNIE